MPDINVTVNQATPVIVTLGQVLPVYQQKETHVQMKFTITGSGQNAFHLSSIPRANSVQAFQNGIGYGADEYSVTGQWVNLNADPNVGDVIDINFVIA